METTLRTLEAKDIAPVTSILAKIGIKEIKDSVDIKAVQSKVAGGEDAVVDAGIDIALDIAQVILSNYWRCQEEIFILLASLTGKKKEEIASLSLADFAELVIAVIKKEEFKDFFSVVSKLFK